MDRSPAAAAQPPAFTVEEAIARWYGDCVGSPKEVDGSPLPYEPRAAWGCEACHAILIGSKSGDLFFVDGDPTKGLPPGAHDRRRRRLPPKVQVRRRHSFGDVSVLAAHGCLMPGCEPLAAGAHALVATSDGRVHFFTSASGEPTPYDVEAIDGVRPAILAARLVQGPDDRPWALATTESAGIQLIPLFTGAGRVPQTLARSARLVLALSGPILGGQERRNPKRERRWLLVSAEGHVASALLMWRGTEPQIGHFEIGHLRHAPNCIAADRQDGRVRSIVYGSNHGLHVALVDKDGIAREHDLLRDRPIKYARVTNIFDVPHVLATGTDGSLWTRRWLHPDDSDRGGWLSWPPLPSEVTFADVSAGSRSDASQAFTTVLLRTHEVYRIPIFNRAATNARLSGATNRLRATPCEETSDAERFAEITTSADAVPFDRLRALVRRGGARTLPAAIASLARPPIRTYREVIDLSVEVVQSAARQGPEEARSLADQLYGALLVYLRDIPVSGMMPAAGEIAERRQLERWTLLLKKYFGSAHTFSEKHRRLDDLAEINRHRDNADAFIYAARLHLQGFDVVSERPITAPVLAIAPLVEPGSDRIRRVGLSYGNGAIEVLTADDDSWQRWSRQTVLEPPPGSSDGVSQPFGNYSRVLHSLQRGGRWFAAPRQELAESVPAELVLPQGWQHPDVNQVYSVLALDRKRLLLGLRDLERPLAIVDTTRGSVQELTASWGTGRHAPTGFAGGERRVWSLALLDDASGIIGVGAEDGYLRFGTISGRRFELSQPGEGHAEFLGSAVRALASWGADLRLFLAGTQHGELYCFGLDRASGAPVLKFRDLVRSAIRSIFVIDVEPGNPQICTLEESGRITTFDILRDRTTGSFLGRRTGHYVVADGATVAVPLGHGRVMVGGWRIDRQDGWVRVVAFRSRDGRSFRKRNGGGDLNRALAAINRSVGNDRSPIECGPERANAVEILASIPLDDAAIRKAVVPRRVQAALTSAEPLPRLRELRDEAFEAYPSDREEIKALLETLIAQFGQGAPLKDQAALFEHLYVLFIEPRRLGPAYGRAKLQATIFRRVMNVHTLRLWQRVRVGPTRTPLSLQMLQNWVERHLNHAEAFVRVDALRAISESLFELLTLKRERPSAVSDVFPTDPPMISAAWLLEALARFLYAHPSSQRGTECDTSTWAAVSVLVNLVRLFPDSVLIICDHIAVRRVDPLVFGVLYRRLTNEADDNIRSRLDRYLPWLGRPSLDAALRITEPFVRSAAAGFETVSRDLKMAAGEPDVAYLRAYAECYHWLGRMIRAGSVSDLIRLRNDRRPIRLPKPPAFARVLWRGRRRFMQFTEKWLNDLKKMPFRHAPSVEAIGTFAEQLERAQQRLNEPGGSPPLFAPERGLVGLVLEHWRSLLRPTLPGPGQRLGNHTLGEALADSTFVFEIVGNRDLLAAIAVVPTAEEQQKALAVWEEIRTLSRRSWSRLVPIDEVRAHPRGPAMIMRRIAGEDLETRWSSYLRQNVEDRALLARGCVIDIAAALADLHEAQLYHGDVQPSNIIQRDEDQSFFLIDFERSGNQARLEAARTRHHRGSHIDADRFGPSQAGVSGLQHSDCMALLTIAVKLLGGASDVRSDFQGSFDIRKFPPYLWPWLDAVHHRWHKSVDAVWTAQDLHDEAVSRGRGVFVSGVTRETEPIRERLYAARGLDDWQVQGHWRPDATRSTVHQLYNLINRSAAVVFLLGTSAGEPARNVPEPLLRKARRLGFPSPSYTICEYLIAMELAKDCLYFVVESPSSTGRDRQRQSELDVIRQTLNRGQLQTVSLANCVEHVHAALRQLLHHRSGTSR
jgi:hypothetical protein